MRDEIASLEINGSIFSNWESLTISRSLDEIVDSFSFSAPFDPTRQDLKTALRPFGYQSAKISIDDELLFVGIVEQISAAISDSVSINVQGRSPAGAMIDSNFEPPYQFDGQTWGAIASKIAHPFDVKIDKSTDTGKIKIAKAASGDGAADFLLGLAKGEGFLMTSSPSGALRLMQIERSAPVASITEGVGSFVSAGLTANSTSRFSVTKAIKAMGDWKPVEAKCDDDAVKLYRPRIVTSEGSSESVIKSANLARSQSIGESCSIDIVVTGWKTDSGHIWTPGDFVTVKAPSVWVLSEYEFIVSTVNFELTNGGRSTSLTLVLPEAKLGGVPKKYPWDDVFIVPEAARRFMS